MAKKLRTPIPSDIAGEIHISKKLHFDLNQAVSITGIAPASIHIEGEVTGGKALPYGSGLLGIEFPNGIVCFDVRNRVAAR